MAENLVQEAGAMGGEKQGARARLAEYLARQPQSKRTFDKVMKGLELAALVLVAGYLAWAIYGSVTWSETRAIVAAWMGLPASVVILLMLVGVHAAGLGAFFPVVVPGSSQEFVTGSRAVAMGIGLAVTLAVVGAFWGAFAWGIWVKNWAILEPLAKVLGVVVGAGAVVALVSDLYKRFSRSR